MSTRVSCCNSAFTPNCPESFVNANVSERRLRGIGDGQPESRPGPGRGPRIGAQQQTKPSSDAKAATTYLASARQRPVRQLTSSRRRHTADRDQSALICYAMLKSGVAERYSRSVGRAYSDDLPLSARIAPGRQQKKLHADLQSRTSSYKPSQKLVSISSRTHCNLRSLQKRNRRICSHDTRRDNHHRSQCEHRLRSDSHRLRTPYDSRHSRHIRHGPVSGFGLAQRIRRFPCHRHRTSPS